VNALGLGGNRQRHLVLDKDRMTYLSSFEYSLAGYFCKFYKWKLYMSNVLFNRLCCFNIYIKEMFKFLKNVVNNIDMSSLRAPWQKGRYKNKHTKQHTNTWTPRRNLHLENNYVLCFADFFKFIINYLKWILQENFSKRIGTIDDFHWGFKPVFRYKFIFNVC